MCTFQGCKLKHPALICTAPQMFCGAISTGTGTAHNPHSSPQTPLSRRGLFFCSPAKLVLFSFAYWQQIVPLLFLSKHFSLFWFNFCLPISCDRSNERTSLGSPGHAPKLTERDLIGPGSGGGGGSFLLLMLINEHRLRSSAQLLQCLPH